MSNLDQAREWAEKYQRHHVIEPEDEVAAVEVIRGLPDHWIDADKVREVLDRWAENPFPTSDEVAVLNDFEALLTPSLQTLADMTPEERDTQKWMQAQVFPTASTLGIITGVDEYAHSAIILFADGMAKNVPWNFITPRPDLPKLEWPGSTPDDVAYATGGALTTQDVVDECRTVRKERALPRPEDVRPGDCWEVETPFMRGVGHRRPNKPNPWFVTYPDHTGRKWNVWTDSDITLVSRLVPEVKP